jgi:hypothetical protein
MHRNAQIVIEVGDVLYIEIASKRAPGDVAYSESLPLKSRQSEIVLDFSGGGELLGIEIIGIDGLLRPE